MVAGCARPLEATARIAWVELIDWMVNDYGFDRLKAYHLLGQVGHMTARQHGRSEIHDGRQKPSVLPRPPLISIRQHSRERLGMAARGKSHAGGVTLRGR